MLRTGTECLNVQRQFDKLLCIKDGKYRREKLLKLESIKAADPITVWE